MARQPSPRLALGARRKLRTPAKHLAAIDAWAETFQGIYPERSARPAEHWHLPVDERLVSPPWAEEAHQARALRALFRAAAHLLNARPAVRASETIYVATHWPSMFMAEVGVFLEPAYAANFDKRQTLRQTWTPLPPHRSLTHELGADTPEGFDERGYLERVINEPDEPAHEGEVWLWRELKSGPQI